MCISSAEIADPTQNIYAEFDDDFDDIEAPVGQCTALYTFEGTFYDSHSSCL